METHGIHHPKKNPHQDAIKRICQWLLFVCLSSSLFSCKKEEKENWYTVYKIRQWQHYADGRQIEKTWSTLYFEYIFDESCLYNDEDLYSSWRNKLYGIWDKSPHKNSARISWRPENKNIILWYYIYNNWERTIEAADTISPWEVWTWSIRYAASQVAVHINEKSKTFDSQQANTLYKNYPYFWWESKAPHDMKFLIKDLE